MFARLVLSANQQYLVERNQYCGKLENTNLHLDLELKRSRFPIFTSLLSQSLIVLKSANSLTRRRSTPWLTLLIDVHPTLRTIQ